MGASKRNSRSSFVLFCFVFLLKLIVVLISFSSVTDLAKSDVVQLSLVWFGMVLIHASLVSND